MDLDLTNIGQTEILLVAGGAVTVSTLLSLLLQAVKDWLPDLRGRRAVAAIYGASFLTALVLVAQTGADPRDLMTWVTIVILTLTLTTTARGIYASMTRDTRHDTDKPDPPAR